ncbi:MAG: PBP1A family penicillin-binding protein [Alphaproteobacteria bacterium]|nr:MAG: PBP1A family penicillin-binding protein [Alphaproteobacteria bacterium]
MQPLRPQPESSDPSVPHERPYRKRRKKNRVLRLIGWCISIGATMSVIGSIIVLGMFYYFSKELPDSGSLADYQPAGMTRLYSSDGVMMAEYAKERRIFVPFEDMPRNVIHAFIAAEDQHFYSHAGIDPQGIVRALLQNLRSMSTGERSLVGGSTITQQVVKNFLLTREKSYERKIKEAILALRITQNYSKDRILELYLNEIYLGMGAYGVAAAAQEYFGKELQALATEEIALLAGMPKAPSYYDPIRRPEDALQRRNYVLGRMAEDGYINQKEYERALASPLIVNPPSHTARIKSPFFSEDVRRWLLQRFGDEKLYRGSLYVHTTADLKLQKIMDDSLQLTLIDYDRRHGYRGAVTHMPSDEKNPTAFLLEWEKKTPLRPEQKLAWVKELRPKEAIVELVRIVPIKDADASAGMIEEVQMGSIPLEHMRWARPISPSGVMGAVPSKPAQIMRVGDVVLVDPIKGKKKLYALAQVPQVNGAMVALRPQTGEVLAMSGGYSSLNNSFNRATQAKRQPGSSFKPFVYLAALERGFSPSSLISDAPISISQGAGKPAWQPKNYDREFWGPTTLRTGLEKSRNVMTVRLSQMIGIKSIIHVGQRLGMYDSLPNEYSSVLGSHETTVLRLATAYGMIANGGLKIEPTLVYRVDDAKGKHIYQSDMRQCAGCAQSFAIPVKKKKDDEEDNKEEMPSPVPVAREHPPEMLEQRERLIDPRIAYQMVSLLRGVVQRGTATSAKKLGFDVAGKTGTTNESRDAWFVGFSQDLVVATYVGYDNPKNLGHKETGGRVALPAFIRLMERTYAAAPPPTFIKPLGIVERSVDRYSGAPSLPWQQGGSHSVIGETYITGGPIFIPGKAMEEPDEAAVASQELQDTGGYMSNEGAYVGTYVDSYGIERQVLENSTAPVTTTNQGFVPPPPSGGYITPEGVYSPNPPQPQFTPNSVQATPVAPQGYKPIPLAPPTPVVPLPRNHPERKWEDRRRVYDVRPRTNPNGSGTLY